MVATIAGCKQLKLSQYGNEYLANAAKGEGKGGRSWLLVHISEVTGNHDIAEKDDRHH